jgi:subtilisin family serine protease
MAPGAGVVAAAPGHGLVRRDGTSFAAPFVSATAALIRQYRPGLHADEVIARILATTDPAPGGLPSPGYGYGILDPYRAVTEQLGPAASAPPPGPVAAPAVVAPGSTGPARGTALVLALAGLGLAGLVALGAAVLPRGAARGWRSG